MKKLIRDILIFWFLLAVLFVIMLKCQGSSTVNL
jgi:hypothetical protein